MPSIVRSAPAPWAAGGAGVLGDATVAVGVVAGGTPTDTTRPMSTPGPAAGAGGLHDCGARTLRESGLASARGIGSGLVGRFEGVGLVGRFEGRFEGVAST